MISMKVPGKHVMQHGTTDFYRRRIRCWGVLFYSMPHGLLVRVKKKEIQRNEFHSFAGGTFAYRGMHGAPGVVGDRVFVKQGWPIEMRPPPLVLLVVDGYTVGSGRV